MDKSPFIMYNIIKGKFNPSEDKDPNAGPDPSGIFKGLIRITDKSLVRKRERKVRRLRRERESKQI